MKHYTQIPSTRIILLLVLMIVALRPVSAQVVMTPPARSVEVRDMTLKLPQGAPWDDHEALRLFVDADTTAETRVDQENLQLIPQASLSWTASDPMVSLAVAKYYLALDDSVYVPLFLLSNLPATGGTDVGNAVTNVLNEFGGLLNVSLGVENIHLALGTSPTEGLFFESRLGIKVLGMPKGEASNERFTAMGQGLASLRGYFPILNRDKQSPAGYLTFLLSFSAQYCGAEAYRSMFVDRLSPFQANGNISIAINIARQLSLAGGGKVWASESQFGKHWFLTLTLLNN